MLTNLANIERCFTPEVINHVDMQPVYDVYASVQGRDLGGVAHDVNMVLEKYRPQLGAGQYASACAGRWPAWNRPSSGLGIGLILAAALVYLLMVVNFQSWLDPFIIITALPGRCWGIVWMLLLTRTTFSVPSLMGAIMAIGVATANSILMVTFANGQRHEGKTPLRRRWRPAGRGCGRC